MRTLPLHLPLHIDFKSAAAYLAIAPTLAMAKRLNINIQWRPLQTNIKPTPEVMPNETKGATHRRVRALARQKTHQMYADLLKVEMQFPSEPGCTDLALAALLQVPHPATDYVTAAFHAYWTQQADLNSEATVTSLLKASHLEVPDFNKALKALAKAQAEAVQAGITDAPAYVLEGHVFIGREHLPWIEALLTA